ncbi:Hemolysin, chromosomal [Polystyrenella longa]|uniref:Hemolysin, chromosomal n=1 Tax=Polystyrenella longa TaxID=2528007 RepID=A0A518CRS9_9PLAN|nr:right-handed parallel beta-helix repeat-containing protein [Polystyrenella longa]QDU81936.1 Hemolysin, chromosomal [Polystyrenella longa]
MGLRLSLSRLLQNSIQQIRCGIKPVPPRRKSRATRFAVEQLETRQMLTPQLSLAGAGVLIVEGTDARDIAHIQENEMGVIAATISDGEVEISRSYPTGLVKSILFFGGDGNDTFRNDTSLPSVAHGENGNDILYGGSNFDRLNGGPGDDRLLGRGGDDELFGNAGNDVLKGHNGNDLMVGGSGNDLLIGGPDDDRLVGGDDHDVLKGGSGNDYLDGGLGDDLLFGQAGIDELITSSGKDLLDKGAEVQQTTEVAPVTSTNEVVASSSSTTGGILRVRDFGAVGDGITDDTAAVQAALDAAEGGELYLNPGTYLISNVLLVPSNTIVSGAGANTVLKFEWRDQAEGREFYLGNKNRANEASGDENIELRDFTLEGGDNGDPYGPASHGVTHGIFFRKVKNVKVTRVEIRNTSGFAISNIGIINGTFTGNTIKNVGRDGITSFPLVQQDDPNFKSYPLENLLISYNRFENVGDDAIAVHAGTEFAINNNLAPTNVTISKNIIVGRSSLHELSQGRGIALTGVRNATIDGNQISNTVSSGILIQSWYNNMTNPSLALEAIRSSNILVTNNTLIEVGVAEGLDRVKIGIQVKGAHLVRIVNNVLRRSADRGIDIRDTTSIEIIANEVYGSLGKSAILLVGGDDFSVRNAIISDNIIDHWNDEDLVINNVFNAKEISGGLDPLFSAVAARSLGGIHLLFPTIGGSGN